jgi:hypothetical protein
VLLYILESLFSLPLVLSIPMEERSKWVTTEPLCQLLSVRELLEEKVQDTESKKETMLSFNSYLKYYFQK